MSASDEKRVSDSLSWAVAISLYLALAVLTTLPGLGSTTLVKMEGMVADMAASMLETGDWLVPKLYGEIYTYKPPFLYWLVASSMKVLGATELALRLPAALSAVVMGLAVVLLLGAAARPRAGLVGGLAAITGLLCLTKTKLAEFDMVLACTVGIAVAVACHNLSARRRSWSPALWLLGYLALTAGFLTKGAPALMVFAPGLLAAAVLTRRLRDLFRWDHLVPAALFVALSVGYLWLLHDAAGPLAFRQPLDEAQRRGLEWTLSGFAQTLAKPVIVFLVFLPWSLLWPWGVEKSFRAHLKGASSGRPDRLMKAAWAFLATGVVVFMVVPTQETRYYLPLSVPAAIVSALAWERSARSSPRAFRWAAAFAALFGGLLVASAFATEFSAGTRAVMASTGIAALLAISLPVTRRSADRVAWALLIVALSGWVTEAWAQRPERARSRDQRAMALAFDVELPVGATVWVPGPAGRASNSGALYFYLDRPVRTFESAGRLPAPGSYVVLTEAEERRLRKEEPAFAARLELLRREESPRYRFLLQRVRSGASAEGGADEPSSVSAVEDPD